MNISSILNLGSSRTVAPTTHAKTITQNQEIPASSIKTKSLFQRATQALHVITNGITAFSLAYTVKAGLQNNLPCVLGALTVAATLKSGAVATRLISTLFTRHQTTGDALHPSMKSSQISCDTVLHDDTPPSRLDELHFDLLHEDHSNDYEPPAQDLMHIKDESLESPLHVHMSMQEPVKKCKASKQKNIAIIVRNIQLHNIEHSYDLLNKLNTLKVLAKLHSLKMNSINKDLREEVLTSLRKKIQKIHLKRATKEAVELTLFALQLQLNKKHVN